MTTSPSTPATTAQALRRTRILIVLGLAAVVAVAVGLQHLSRSAVLAVEAKVVAADFPELRLEQGVATVDEFGRVAVDGLLREPPLSVGSQRLTPPGRYVEILIANDGVAAHVRKTELVIGARDADDRWHPQSAGAVAERVRGGKTP
ncbi:MAG: hypothetical protein VKQ33_16215 [Candidatus Sericytochromatia bacterium]|nr:hypothetical protein [Candidatus Sericytochromatia bacterium]